jgi:hypothetical protein
LKRFDRYPEDAIIALLEPFDYARMSLPWEVNLSGAYDSRCVIDD